MNLKSLIPFTAASVTALPAFAEEAAELAEKTAEQAISFNNALFAFAVAGCIALPACFGALAMSRAAAAALEGIARNPGAQKQLFTPMILAFALIESLVIYALLITFILSNKL